MVAKKKAQTLQIAVPNEPRSIPDYESQITTAMRTIAAQWIGTDGKREVSARTGPSVYAGYALQSWTQIARDLRVS